MIRLAHPNFGYEEEQALLDVLRSGILVNGSKTKQFEEEIAKYVGRTDGIAVSSGTAGLHSALQILSIGQEDEVITTPFSFIATANAILFSNARPVFVDIEEDTFMLNPSAIQNAITEKTKAVVAVDLFGQTCDYTRIKKLTNEKGVYLVEDACQSIGASHNQTKAGAFGDISIFSFYATKNITCGEGGMLLTDNKNIAEKAREFRNHGQAQGNKYKYLNPGYNYRMTEMQAALGIQQLKKLEQLTIKRQKNALLLTQLLSTIKEIKLPLTKNEDVHVFHQYTICVASEVRDALCKFLLEKGIETGIFYPFPLHLYNHFERLGYKKGDFPIAERIATEVLSLPIHPLISDEDIKKINRCIRDFYGKS